MELPGFQTTYEELKLRIINSSYGIDVFRFQTTYEELKLASSTFSMSFWSCFQTTYEELKPGGSKGAIDVSSFQTTYEELKPCSIGLRPYSSSASRLPMRN